MDESIHVVPNTDTLFHRAAGQSEMAAGGRLGRRRFLGEVGRASLAGLAVGGPASSVVPQRRSMKLDPQAPLRIGMIGREGHIGYVLDELDSVRGARVAAYAFEDGDWTFNCDGSRRGGTYDMSVHRRWVESQSWSRSRLRLYETYQEMLEKESLDLVVVCLPFVRNAYAIAAAAGAGRHVLTEKPVAVTISDLDMVEKAVRRSGIRLSAMFAMRYLPNIYTVRNAVERGDIGRPILARAQKSYQWGDERPWYYRHREIYGSTILWVGIHAVDYLCWATGLEVRKVSGFHSNLTHPDYAGVQDNAVISLELDGGATAAVTMDFLRPSGAPTHGDDRLRIAGSEGIVETMDPDGRVRLLRKQKAPRELEPEAPPASLFADLVSELRGEGTHLIGPSDAIEVTRVCIVATQAAETGRVLSIRSGRPE